MPGEHENSLTNRRARLRGKGVRRQSSIPSGAGVVSAQTKIDLDELDNVDLLLEAGLPVRGDVPLAGGRPMTEPKHCDDYIDDECAPVALRRYLERARSPGHGLLSLVPFPTLFADHDGKRVRVVMASRFGDVGITALLDKDCGYALRVMVEDLSNFGDAP